jgi:hypothetical protein
MILVTGNRPKCQMHSNVLLAESAVQRTQGSAISYCRLIYVQIYGVMLVAAQKEQERENKVTFVQQVGMCSNIYSKYDVISRKC